MAFTKIDANTVKETTQLESIHKKNKILERRKLIEEEIAIINKLLKEFD